MTRWFKRKLSNRCVFLGKFIMEPRIKCVLVDNIASEWKRFANYAGFTKAAVDYIDLDKNSDQLKIDEVLKLLDLRNPSDFIFKVEKSLTLMGKIDILNEIQTIRK